MRSAIIGIFILFVFSCQQNKCADPVSANIEVSSIPVDRIEGPLFASQSVEDVLTVLNDNRTFTDFFLHAQEYPNDTLIAEKIFKLIQNPFIDTLYQEAMMTYPNLDILQEQLGYAHGALQSLFPDTKPFRLQTAVTGLYNDLLISDTLVIVGLDYFIGDEASFKPRELPAYILDRYDSDHLGSVIVKFMAGTHVSVGKTETLISEMIDFGKTYYLTKRLMPCTPDSILLGYTSQDMKLIYENEAIIWANLVENEVLYETSHITKRKFLGERPNVYEISQKCPGRIGAWVGWRIVEDYMKNTDTDLITLLNTTNNDEIFGRSGYKPSGNR